jgi:putative transposase
MPASSLTEGQNEPWLYFYEDFLAAYDPELLTDLYSRKIIGWFLSETLEAQGALEALKKALAGLARPQGLIHHSDRGVQYCCEDYVKELRKNQLGISMAEVGNPYENAVAERVNGILKNEFYLDRTFEGHIAARRAVADAIESYNHERPHMSIGLLTPAVSHEKQIREAA